MSADAERNFSGKHLVVFGCGYVGTLVATQARARGLRVTALTRNADKAMLLREAGFDVVVRDLAGDGWHGEIAEADLVLNCVSSGGGGLDNYRRSYVEGMASLVAWAARERGLETLVYTSSTSVYPQDGGAIVDESATTAGASERGRILLEAERLLREGTPGGARAFVLRPAGIYGPGRHHLLDQVRAGEVAGVGTHRLNLAHRDDIAAAVWACFDAPRGVASAVFNVADDAPTPKAEVVAWLAGRLGKPPPRFTGEPAGTRRTLTPDRVISAAKLKTALGWRPRFPTFREGYESLLSL